MSAFRKIIFWAHLAAGICSGAVIFSLALSGALITFQGRILSFAERNLKVSPPAEARRLDPETLVEKARSAAPGESFAGITFRSDPSEPATLSFGLGRTVFINPYTGETLGEGAKNLRNAFSKITSWHRTLGAGRRGRAITGASSVILLALTGSGIFLWWPKGGAYKNAAAFKGGLSGKARDWNLHTVAGFWCSAVLAVLALTGIFLSYPILEARPGVLGTPLKSERPAQNQPLRLNALWDRAQNVVGDWKFISLRPPQGGSVFAYVSVERGSSRHPYPRSLLTFDSFTGEVVSAGWFENLDFRGRISAWVRPVHTGEAGGLAFQILVFLACCGAGLIAWTGFALALRRFFSKTSLRRET